MAPPRAPRAPRPRRSRPLALAGALVRASTRASTELVASTVRSAARTAERVAAPVGSALVAADLGVGRARLTPDGAEWARQQVARGLRELLATDLDTSELLRATDPTVMARAVLALLGGDERLTPMPSADEQIRQRFRALLDPDGRDVEGMTPALLAITAQLSPDEARVLRYLHDTDRVPVVSVMAGSMGSRTGPVVAEHLSLVVERAGGDHPERGPEYVGNLLRLGLCTVEDRAPTGHRDIDLVTAGAHFQGAIRAVRDQGARPRVTTRTLRLTALGRRLVDIALHGAASGAETAALSGPPSPPRAALDERS